MGAIPQQPFSEPAKFNIVRVIQFRSLALCTQDRRRVKKINTDTCKYDQAFLEVVKFGTLPQRTGCPMPFRNQQLGLLRFPQH